MLPHPGLFSHCPGVSILGLLEGVLNVRRGEVP